MAASQIHAATFEYDLNFIISPITQQSIVDMMRADVGSTVFLQRISHS